MAYSDTTARRFDWLRRFWFDSFVKNRNVRQCPRCAGTDKAHEVYEGWGCALWRCLRCCRDWWT